MKYYIYKARCLEHNLSIKGFLSELYFSYNTLELLATEDIEINNFRANWEKIGPSYGRISQLHHYTFFSLSFPIFPLVCL